MKFHDFDIHTPTLVGKTVHLTRSPNADATGEFAPSLNIFGVVKGTVIITDETGATVLAIYLDGFPTPVLHGEQTVTEVRIRYIES